MLNAHQQNLKKRLMNTFKNYITGFSLAISAIAFGQGTSSVSYSSSTENITGSLNSETATENVILSPKEKIDANLDNMLSDVVLKNANWGFVVYDPKTKKIVSSYNETTPLVPASTTKLLTTETAFNLLGENFKWTTQLEYSGEIDENGVLNGNLYIVGSGDPSLGTGKAGATTYRNLITEYISSMKNEGIKKVNGNIVIQTAVFKENKRDTLPENIVWMDHENYFLPIGGTAGIDPKKEKMIVRQSNPFANSRKYFYVSPYTGKMVYTDEFSGDFITTKLPDAPAYLANNLRATMLKSGVGISGKVVTKMTDPEPENRKILDSYHSPTLAEIIYYTNKHSDNALAEALLRVSGFQKKGNQTLESGRSTVLEHLENIGFDTSGLNYIDGSGLSHSNTVMPIAQVKFLSSLMDKKYFKSYFESLPIGGQDGTLKSMFLGSGYGLVNAKTGTLNKVKTLAGFIKTNSGKTLIFSLMVNNYAGSVAQVKQRMERILEPVLNY